MYEVLIVGGFAALLLALCLPGLRRDRRQPAAVPEPERIATARPALQPSGAVTGPFGYDNGLTVEPADKGGESP